MSVAGQISYIMLIYENVNLTWTTILDLIHLNQVTDWSWLEFIGIFTFSGGYFVPKMIQKHFKLTMHSKVQTSVIWPSGQLILSLVYIWDITYLSLDLWCFLLSLFQLVFEGEHLWKPSTRARRSDRFALKRDVLLGISVHPFPTSYFQHADEALGRHLLLYIFFCVIFSIILLYFQCQEWISWAVRIEAGNVQYIYYR